MRFLKLFKDYPYQISENYTKIDKDNPYKVLDDYDVTDEYSDTYLGKKEYKARLYQKNSNNPLSTIIYTDSDGDIEIISTMSHIKGEGYSQILMIYLAKKYGYQNLNRKVLTAGGVKMRQRLDDLFDYDYKSATKTNHLERDVISNISEKHPLAAQIIDFFVNYGKTANDIDRIFNESEKLIEVDNSDYEVETLFKISQWIQDSKTNKNDSNSHTPNQIQDLVDSLL